MKETFSAQCVVSNVQRNLGSFDIKNEIKHKLINQIASHIAEATIKEHVADFNTTYSCRVIICDVDHFWEIVHNKARDYGFHQTPTWINDKEIK